jgi:RHS repeat-associated protein
MSRLTAAVLGTVLALLTPGLAVADPPLTAMTTFETYADGFSDLRGVAIDAAGNVFVADRDTGLVWRIARDRTRVTVASGLERPIGLAIDLTGRLLIAEERAARVVRVEPNGSRTLLVSGIKQPRWLAVHEDGTLYITARRLTRGTDPEPDDESAEPEMVLALSPAGALSVFADGFRQLQGLAIDDQALYVATTGLKSAPRADGVVFRIAIGANGIAGTPTPLGSSDEFKKPLGVARDRLGAFYLTTKEFTLAEDRSKRAVAKLHPGAHVTLFAENLSRPQGLAFDAAGHLYVTDGSSGRVLRFFAPAPPVLTTPAFTNQTDVSVTGTAEAGARVDLFVDHATTALSGTASAAGAFTIPVTLAANSATALEAFATGHGGEALTSAPADTTVTHDSVAPSLVFRAPPALAHIRRTVSVQLDATDASGVSTLSLTVDGQSLTATVAPTPPASPVIATTSWDTWLIADGSHTLGANATDRAGNTATAARVVIVDNTPPETVIDSGPSGEIGVTSASFTFSGTDNLTPTGNLVFAWRLDGGTWSAFTATTTASFTGLSEAAHTFEVIARDLAGNEDPTPAARTFTIRVGPSITDVAPASGTIGTFVTITGAGFEPGATTVTFNGLAAVIRTISPTVITTTVPIGASTGRLRLVTSRGSASRTFTVTLTGDFTLTASPATVRAIVGDQGSAHIAVFAGGTFTNLVAPSVAPAVSGITATFGAPSIAPGASTPLTFRVDASVAAGTYAFTVIGSSSVDGRTVTRTAPVSLEVLPPDTHAVTGRIMTAESLPLPIPGVSVALGSAFVLTDAAGNFVLLAPPPGPNMLFVDGRTASVPDAQFPIVEVQITVASSGPTRVPFTIYLPKLDTGNAITLPLDAAGFTTQEVKATTPRIPGLEVTIPAGTRIVGPDGNPVGQLVITPVPIDRSPMPFPPGKAAPMLFAINPGGAVPSNPLPISFPNITEAAPGTKADMYYFDLAIGNWNIWGTGTVSADGRQVVSDPGTGLPRLAWHWWDRLRDFLKQLGKSTTGGEPVDLATGAFFSDKTDLVLPGRMPIAIQRSYRSDDMRPGFFGVGWNLDVYDSRLTSAGTTLNLVTPDQNTVQLRPDGPGRWVSTDAALLGAVVTQLPGEFNFQIRYKDGTVHRYDRIVGFANTAGLVAITDRNDNTVTVTRESPGPGRFGLITRITEPGGRSFTLVYDAANRITSATDPIGRVVRYTYDAQGRLETVTDAAGGVTRYAYDGQHRMVSITDPRNITYLTNEYDAAGRVARQRQGDNSVFEFVYTVTAGNTTETTVIDPLGHSTTHRFDSLGLALSTTDALGQTTTRTYAPATNQPLSTTDALGRTVRYAYDAVGNLTSLIDPAGQARILAYEPTFNLLRTITNPLGQISEFRYDARGNLTHVIDAAGQATTMTYDAIGQVRTITDPLANTTTLGYDSTSNVTSLADPLGNTVRREYDGAGRMVRQVDPRGRATPFEYDALNRLTTIVDATGGVTRMTYDANGNLDTVTDPRQNVLTHTHDVTDRLITRTYPDGTQERYEYDLAGRLVRLTDRAGRITTMTYDALDRRLAVAYADGQTTGFTYDAGGRVIEANDSAGGMLQHEYDVLDRLLAQISPTGGVNYGYDVLGRRTLLDVPGTTPVAYRYDGTSRLERIEQGSRAVDLAHDLAGRRTRLTLPNGVSTDYQYDATSRLAQLTIRNAAATIGDLTYTYDATGNIVGRGGSLATTLLPAPVDTAAYAPDNRQLAFGDVSVAHDPHGNVTELAEPGGTKTMTWDARNRLVRLTGGGVDAAFTYDAAGRRIRAIINDVTTDYLYDGPDVAMEIRDSTARGHLRLLSIDSPISRDDREFYLTDVLGSVIGVTDETGSLVARYSYEPFGRSALESGTSDNPLRFTGREDDGTGLLYYRARYYSPALHRFLGPDMILRAGANRYGYVDDNPVNAIDPFGLETIMINGGVGSSGPGGSSAGARPVNRGLARIKERLEQGGETVHGVFNSGAQAAAVKAAIDAKRRGEPVYIIGHSLGGERALRVAAELARRGITPDHVFTIDPFIQDGTTVPPGVPVTNFYQENVGWASRFIRGREVVGADANVLITGTSHLTITEHGTVRDTIQNTILAPRTAPSLGGRY